MLGAMDSPIGKCGNPTANQNGKQVCGSQAVVLPWGRRKWLPYPPQVSPEDADRRQIKIR